MTDHAHEDESTASPSDLPAQSQDSPGETEAMRPRPDHGEHSYRGSHRLDEKRALITGADSGIGRATAIAFAREGCHVAISYLPEEQADAEETARWVRQAEREAVLLPADLRDEENCRQLVARAVSALGGLDVIVLNAGYQHDHDAIENLASEELERVMKTNLYATLWLTRAVVPHLESGANIIATASIQGFHPSPTLIDYAMTKAAIVAYTKALAEELGPQGIRVNAVAPGPIWTPLIPATGWPPEKIEKFGQDTPLGRPGQPAEVAGAYVYLASDEASYVSGAILAVTGGKAL